LSHLFQHDAVVAEIIQVVRVVAVIEGPEQSEGIAMAHSGNIQGTFREHSGNVRETIKTEIYKKAFREHSGHIQGAFRNI
jgi:hypothetical protein